MTRKAVLSSALTGILLTLAFPPAGWWPLAWIAFVPLHRALFGLLRSAQALTCGAVTGVFFFGFSMHWLTEVSTAGWLLWTALQVPYFMVFSWLTYLAYRRTGSSALRIVWTASVWTALEIIRADLPIFGVGWNLVAYSQAPCPIMIQTARIFGAYGLGFLIMLVNACAHELWAAVLKRDRRRITALTLTMSLVLGAAFIYGKGSFADEDQPEEYLRVSVLQGNIPQAVKWQIMAKDQILSIYEKLTLLAALDQPDLIVWPEASFPGYFNRDVQSARVLSVAREARTPVLAGGLHWVNEREVYNSAYLIDKEGKLSERRYDKVRLVPFGEYIPLKFLFGWLKPVADALGIGDFSAGRDPVVFQWAREEWPFGVLICFEDIFSDLAKDMADRGANMLVVITNDAWFGRTGAPYQHLQASIFRAVENGVAVVRAANTGVSAFISHRGEVLGTVKNKKGEETFTLGHKTLDLPLRAIKTAYRQGGHGFPYVVFLILAGAGVFLMKIRRTT
ncbi:MAG: apolipoprotein N-acyltransferase [Candidatus Omnitrophica bacterium]|nr:apolipoprotein N-acyltransferase [Candidatus Omnitrophota bacterium]